MSDRDSTNPRPDGRGAASQPYFHAAGDALSQLLNAVVFNSGNANQSLSGRCDEEKHHWLFGKLRVGINALFFVITYLLNKIFPSVHVQKDHCKEAYDFDIQRAEARLKKGKQLCGNSQQEGRLA